MGKRHPDELYVVSLFCLISFFIKHCIYFLHIMGRWKILLQYIVLSSALGVPHIPDVVN